MFLTNSRGERIPAHLADIGRRVHRLVSCPTALRQWRSIVRTWCQEKASETVCDFEAEPDFDSEAIKSGVSVPTKSAKTPNDNRADKIRVPGDFYPLPVGLNWFDGVAVLSAVHDYVISDPVKRIGPYDRDDEVTHVAVKFLVLLVTVKQYDVADAKELRRLIRQLPIMRHSPDFRSVRWGSEIFSFTVGQAMIVEQLWKLFRQGTPDVSAEYLACNTDVGFQGRFDSVFRKGSKYHPAWGTMIIPGGSKGAYRLQYPPEFEKIPALGRKYSR